MISPPKVLARFFRQAAKFLLKQKGWFQAVGKIAATYFPPKNTQLVCYLLIVCYCGIVLTR